MLAGGTKTSGEVIGTQLSPADFYSPVNQILYDAIYAAYFADEPIDPLSVGETASKRLAQRWNCDEQDAIVRVRDMAMGQQFSGKVLDHSKVVKKHSDYRHLLSLAASIAKEVGDETRGPEEIAGIASHQAMKIATASLLTHDLISFGDLGRNYVHQMERLKKASEEGLELGAYFELRFFDRYLKGLQPTEVLFVAGEPGVGKSAVVWKAAIKFAQRQSTEEKPIATLVLSLEMGEGPSNNRIAQTIAQVDGGKLREGKIDQTEFTKVFNEWAKRKDLPLFFNFTSHMRASQIRALCVEAIRRHNVGLIIIDHFRYFDLDERIPNKVDEDEEKARFLKEAIAKDLNCAVICIAHTTKGIENQEDRRPTLSNLRGSGQVAAHADFVAFVYRPFKYADEDEKLTGQVSENDAEMIWRKNRHGLEGIEEFYFRADTMDIKDQR
jgi:replicative DNA helicase